MKYAETLKIGTLNIRGTMEAGKREMVEIWMKSNDVNILLLQETKTRQNVREVRKDFVWFFSGEAHQQEYTHGVGFVIRQHIVKHIVDIHPHSDRLAVAVLKIGATFTLNLISAYAPHAGRTEEEKEAFYEDLQLLYSSYKNKGPTWIMGDMNARIVKATSEEEQSYIGKFTFRPESASALSGNDGIVHNRSLLVSFCMGNECILANTWFKKQDRHLASYRTPGTEQTDLRVRPNFEQLDYILIPRKWRNAIRNVGVDDTANINSDHFPIIVTSRLYLAKNRNVNQHRNVCWLACNDEQWQNYNLQITEEIRAAKENLPANCPVPWNYFKEIAERAAEQHIPKAERNMSREVISFKTKELIQQRQDSIFT